MKAALQFLWSRLPGERGPYEPLIDGRTIAAVSVVSSGIQLTLDTERRSLNGVRWTGRGREELFEIAPYGEDLALRIGEELARFGGGPPAEV